MLLSVSIVIYELRVDELILCLRSLNTSINHAKSLGSLSSATVTIVDNGNNKSVIAKLREQHSVISDYIETGANLGKHVFVYHFAFIYQAR